MKPSRLALLALGLIFSLCLPAAVAAQESLPPAVQQPAYRAPDLAIAPDWDDAGPAARLRPATSEPQASAASAPAIAIGQPGLSYRYVQTFGETERAYFDDTAHLNYPYGLTTDGNNVWIADSDGLRAVKYANDGTFLAQIGKTGFRYGAGQDLQSVADVGVDSTGNIWLVDSDVSHILKFDANGKYLSKLGMSYNSGQSNDRFHGPHSIAFDSAGNIYVSDSWNSRIQVFKSDGSYLATIGVTGVEGSDNTHFCNPQHIVITGSALWVADACNHRIQVFNVANPAAAVYLATIGVSGQSGSDNAHLDHPLGVAVDANRIYVADENNHRVQVFSRSTGAYQATISLGWGQDNAHLRHPADVAVDAAGNIYVADWLNARVQQFNSSLAYVRTYGATGVPYLTDTRHYNTPSGLAVAPDGSIYVTEAHGQRLLRLDAGGTAQWVVGVPGVVVDTDANDRLNNPRDVALAPSGLIYVADSGNDRIQIFNPDGSYYGTLGNGWGTGNYQFKWPTGLFITADGAIYVADYNNQRVQVYNSNRVYVATLGVTGVAGSDNAHFQNPRDVVVDARGYIYVSENGNYRVQVFDANRNYLRTIGVTGEGGNGFDHLNGPHHLAVDAHNNLYVSSNWNSAVHVYNQDGAYLTTIGGSRGNRSGQLAGPYGLAFDAAGNLYVADSDNHRIQKFAPGVPGWRQVNINGFGSLDNQWAGSLMPFAGALYAGVYNYSGTGAQLWRFTNTGGWEATRTDGFGNSKNEGIRALAEFDQHLYVGTENWQTGTEIWRSSDGTAWENVKSNGFGGGVGNPRVSVFGVWKNQLYAAVGEENTSTARGAEVWRSTDGINWTNVITVGFGDVQNRVLNALEQTDKYLYAGTWNAATGGEVWRSESGDPDTWTQVNSDGFGTAGNSSVVTMASFGGYIYAGTRNWDTGAEVWRSPDGTTWSKVIDGGFGVGPNAGWVDGLVVFRGHLFAVVRDYWDGLRVWQSADGEHWIQTGPAGFGDSNNARTSDGDIGIAIFGDRLFMATYNPVNGTEIWQKTLTADFTATPTRGAPPLTVQFTNTSAGDFTTSQWDFGDGATSAETSPTHTYTVPGTYAVTLTVGDGTDTSAITKPGYIVAKRFTFLPLVTRNWDPLLYDDFNDVTWDGTWNPALWHAWDTTGFDVRQENGAMVFSNPSPIEKTTTLDLQRWGEHSLGQLRLFQARLKISSDRSGGGSAVWIHFGGKAAGYDDWYTECGLEGRPGDTAYAHCQIAQSQGQEYQTPDILVNYDTWYTLRIEIDPATANMRFFLDNTLLGSHTPKDAAALLSANTLSPRLAALNFDQDGKCTRYVDDVRITPAR